MECDLVSKLMINAKYTKLLRECGKKPMSDKYNNAQAMRELREQRRKAKLCLWCDEKPERIEWLQLSHATLTLLYTQLAHQCTKCRRKKLMPRVKSNGLYCQRGGCHNYARVKRYRTGRGVFDATLLKTCELCAKKERDYNAKRKEAR